MYNLSRYIYDDLTLTNFNKNAIGNARAKRI